MQSLVSVARIVMFALLNHLVSVKCLLWSPLSCIIQGKIDSEVLQAELSRYVYRIDDSGW